MALLQRIDRIFDDFGRQLGCDPFKDLLGLRYASMRLEQKVAMRAKYSSSAWQHVVAAPRPPWACPMERKF